MQQQMIADPVSRDKLREYALFIRKQVGCDQKLYFPVIHYLEWVLCNPDIFGYELQIPTIFQMTINHGETDPIGKTIRIREDIYRGACDDNGRDRFTVAHEVGHALLHCSVLKLTRADPGAIIRTYCDPEWQADAFAGELLMPKHLIKNMTVTEIVQACKVSNDAACFQKRKI